MHDVGVSLPDTCLSILIFLGSCKVFCCRAIAPLKHTSPACLVFVLNGRVLCVRCVVVLAAYIFVSFSFLVQRERPAAPKLL